MYAPLQFFSDLYHIYKYFYVIIKYVDATIIRI